MTGCNAGAALPPELILTNSMFSCDVRPAIPDMAAASDADLGRFIKDLELRGDDCADQLALVKNHLEVNGIVITDVLVKKEKAPVRKIFGIKY